MARTPKKSTDEQKAEAKAAVETLHARLMSDLKTGSDWLDFIAYMSQFRGYSARNLMWMQIQWEERQFVRRVCRAIEVGFFGAPLSPLLPEFTQPAAGGKWKEMGGMINKGEKALSVLAPIIIKDKNDLDEHGKPKEKFIGTRLINRTYDISQINGVEAPPSPAKRLEGEGPDGVWDALVALAEANEFTVKLTEIAGETNGRCNHLTQEIEIEVRNEKAQQVKTLAHEIGHMFLHGEAAMMMPRGVKEVEAESVAYTTLKLMGFDTSDYSVGYVGGWSGGNAALLASTAERVINLSVAIAEFLATGEMPAIRASAKFKFEDASADTALAA